MARSLSYRWRQWQQPHIKKNCFFLTIITSRYRNNQHISFVTTKGENAEEGGEKRRAAAKKGECGGRSERPQAKGIQAWTSSIGAVSVHWRNICACSLRRLDNNSILLALHSYVTSLSLHFYCTVNGEERNMARKRAAATARRKAAAQLAGSSSGRAIAAWRCARLARQHSSKTSLAKIFCCSAASAGTSNFAAVTVAHNHKTALRTLAFQAHWKKQLIAPVQQRYNSITQKPLKISPAPLAGAT